jgi:hypothetical protein
MGTIATPATAIEQVSKELKRGLAGVQAVRSVHTVQTDLAIAVWIDIAQDDRSIRNAIYDFEDQVSQRFPGLRFDFHVIPVPDGKKMEDFISAAQVVFRRVA